MFPFGMFPPLFKNFSGLSGCSVNRLTSKRQVIIN